MKVTTKGQVTIPQEIRDRLGLHPGCEVEFRVSGKLAQIRLAKASKRRPDDFIDRMRGTATVKMTTDEIMALTRSH